MDDVRIGIIGGSGLYAFDGVEVLEEVRIDTPFGAPSDAITVARLGDRKIAFLPRHGRGHRHNPTQVPVRANFWALKKLGVFWVVGVSAVGSLRKEIRPRDFVIPDQIIDRTRNRVDTLFDDIAVHAGFSLPYHPQMRRILLDACTASNVVVHDGGTYVCMEGPLFSTKAESELHRSWGASLIGMTAVPEAKLAREASMCYAAICLATDYDVWHEQDYVDVSEVLANIEANVANVKAVLRNAIPAIPVGEEDACDASRALEHAVLTRPDLISDEAWSRVGIFLETYLRRP